MILLVPTLKVGLAVSAVRFDQAHDISPKLRVAFQIKTADFNISESPNSHNCALLCSLCPLYPLSAGAELLERLDDLFRPEPHLVEFFSSVSPDEVEVTTPCVDVLLHSTSERLG